MDETEKSKWEMLYKLLNDEFSVIKDKLTNHDCLFDNLSKDIYALKDRVTHIEALLSNHVTDTNKKIEVFTKEVSEKLDKLLNK